MAKVKIMKFEASNNNTQMTYKDKQEMEDTINSFIKDKELLGIHINVVETQEHEFSKKKYAYLLYTIVYEEE